MAMDAPSGQIDDQAKKRVKIRNLKHEIRNKSKSRKNRKFKGRVRAVLVLEFPLLGFEIVSDFGFRIFIRSFLEAGFSYGSHRSQDENPKHEIRNKSKRRKAENSKGASAYFLF
ncbi:MAG TPA: hypothetical protein VFC78_18385 [Tepidisphaeraceae bacterium]|nr:hypothetical protein [Tepidisphaeraceae bacterium]